MTIKEKIFAFLAEMGIKKTDFYESTGIQSANFKGKNMQSQLGGDMIVKILTTYPQLSSEWLLTDRGEMLKPDVPSADIPGNDTAHEQPFHSDKGTKKNTSVQGKTKESSSPHVAHPSHSPQQGIPLIPFSAMAGALKGEQTALEYECEHYIIPAFSGADFLMPVKGNSMTPTYISGDIVACQRVPMTSLFFQWNKPYVLDTSQGAIIKRIKPGSDKNHVLIVSDNTDYDPFELPYEDIYAVALVIGIIRLE